MNPKSRLRQLRSHLSNVKDSQSYRMNEPATLPSEIWVLILGYLKGERDKATIESLNMVSKQLNRLSRPLLHKTIYDSIEQNRPHEGGLQKRTWDIVRDTELAGLVKTVIFSQWDFMGQDNRGKYRPSKDGAPSKDEYEGVLWKTKLPEQLREAVLDMLVEESPAAHLSLLLVLCVNLQHLEVPCGYEAFSEPLKRTITFGIRACSSSMNEPRYGCMFSSLASFSVGSSKYRTGVADVASFFSLSTFQSLSAINLVDSHPTTDLSWKPVFSAGNKLNSRAIDIHLDKSFLSQEGLSLLLDSCPGPCSLAIRWRYCTRSDDISNIRIGQALRDHGGRITSLVIDTTDIHRHQYGAYITSFGSLASLTSLTRLAIPRYVFFSSRYDTIPAHGAVMPAIGSWPRRTSPTFPPSLEDLYILGVDEETLDGPDFEDMVIDAQLPRLKRVIKVPEYTYKVDEWFGPIEVKGVDYKHLERIGDVGLGFSNLSETA